MKSISIISYFIIIFNCLSPLHSQEINITGQILDQKNEPVPNASITIREITSGPILTYSLTDKDGKYNLKFQADSLQTLIIEIRSLGYTNFSEEIEIAPSTSSLTKNFTLSSEINQLEPVHIVAENRGIRIKKDTTTFSLNKFGDGTEKTVEDMLDKLPGIEVFEDGKIQYKGKDIQKVLLDGDDLFGHNYTIGTRNISVDLVEQIEAIERYSENPLLKGIENSDKVALNLKLKEDQIDFSGNATLGIGHESKYYADIITLAISKKAKNMTNLQYNNTGINNTPFDFSSSVISLADLNDEELQNNPLLIKPVYGSFIERKNVLENDNFFGNTNQIINLSKTSSIRFNLSYFKDKIKTARANNQTYFSELDTVNYFQETRIAQIPRLINGTYKYSRNLSENSLFEAEGKLNLSKTTTFFDYELNELPENEINSLANETFIKQELTYTKKINDLNAIQAGGRFSYNKIPEKDFYSHPLILNDNSYTNQHVQQLQRNIQAYLSLIGAKNNIKYSSSFKTDYVFDELNSILFNSENSLKEITNGVSLNNFSLGFDNSLSIFLDKWLLRLNLGIFYLSSEKEESFRLATHHLSKFTFNPDIHIRYNLNNKSKIEVNYFYEQKPLNITNLYGNSILLSNTTLKKNIINLETLKSHKVNLLYSYFDLYNSFGFTTEASYLRDFNPLISNINISKNFIQIISFISPRSNERYEFDISTEKLIYALSSKFEFNFNYSKNLYYNQVNSAALELKELDRYEFNLDYVSAFKEVFNFGNSLKYIINNATIGSNSISNTFLKNNLSFTVRPAEGLYAKINFDYYIPDTKKPKEDFLLSNATINYSRVKSKLDYALTIYNLTGEEEFKRIFISDYSRSSTIQEIVPSSVVLKVSFRF